MERAGHEVFTAPNGRVATKEYLHKTIDLIVIDIVMPEQNGIETIYHFHTQHPDLKIVAISGGGLLDPQSYLRIAKTAGALRTLTKPFEPDKLLALIDELHGTS